MGGSRFAYRAWKDRALYGRMMIEGEPVLSLVQDVGSVT